MQTFSPLHLFYQINPRLSTQVSKSSEQALAFTATAAQADHRKERKEKPLATLCQRLFVRLRCNGETTPPQTEPGQPAAIMAGWPSTAAGKGSSPRPARRQKEMRQHLGAWGESPSGCRAEPCRPPRRRGTQERYAGAKRPPLHTQERAKRKVRENLYRKQCVYQPIPP
ncbi:hypothetical protein D3Z52_16405 [Clostridiaceae bacterium]|nr:hypothetical protein [Clostridiaceae bacterium]